MSCLGVAAPAAWGGSCEDGCGWDRGNSDVEFANADDFVCECDRLCECFAENSVFSYAENVCECVCVHACVCMLRMLVYVST